MRNAYLAAANVGDVEHGIILARAATGRVPAKVRVHPEAIARLIGSVAQVLGPAAPRSPQLQTVLGVPVECDPYMPSGVVEIVPAADQTRTEAAS